MKRGQSLWLAAMLMVLAVPAQANEPIKAKDQFGAIVYLYPDGTWSKTKRVDGKAIHRVPKTATAMLKGQQKRYVVWYDADKWQVDMSEDAGLQWQHKTSDARASAAFSEGEASSLEDLKTVVLASIGGIGNLVSDEVCNVNGADMLCLTWQSNGEANDRKRGYFYSNEHGSYSFVVESSESSAATFRDDFVSMLNGLLVR